MHLSKHPLGVKLEIVAIRGRYFHLPRRRRRRWLFRRISLFRARHRKCCNTNQQQKLFWGMVQGGAKGCRLNNSKFSDKNVRRKKSLLYLPLVTLLPPLLCLPQPYLLAIAIIVYFLTLLSKWSDPCSAP